MADPANLLGEKIRRRRKTLDISQEMLARLAGFPAHQTISQIEKGEREVKAWELVKLARALRVSVQEILAEGEPGPAAAVLWRKQPEEGRTLREAEFLGYCRSYHRLEILAEAQPHRTLPSISVDPERLDWNDITRLAEDVSRELGLGVRPAASLVGVLEERYGVKIWYLDLGQEGSAACVEGDFGPAILMNRIEAPWRRNFNFAHELFHIITWKSAPPTLLQSKPDLSGRFEQFANHFASNLLLPADSIVHEVNRRIGERGITCADLIGIAREFDVSTEALIWRLVAVGGVARPAAEKLLRDENFRALDRSTMFGRWWKPPPLPERFVRLAFIAYQKEKISRARLAQYLETSLLDLRNTLLDYGLDESADYDTAISAA